MNIETMIENASEDELRALVSIMKKANDRPAILVTVGKRRYVVAQEDEHLFDGITTPDDIEERYGHMGAIVTAFGAQWLRGYGRVDEMYRTLSLSEVTKIARADRRKVWGS